MGGLCGQIFHQRPPFIGGAVAAPALEFRHEEVDDIEVITWRLGGMFDHEATTAAGRLKFLFEVIGHLRRGTSDGLVVAGRDLHRFAEELLAGEFQVGIATKRHAVD